MSFVRGQLYLLNTRRENSKAHRTYHCTSFKSETILLPTILANHFLNGKTGPVAAKKSGWTCQCFGFQCTFFSSGEQNTDPKSMDYSHGLPIWTTPKMDWLRRWSLVITLSIVSHRFLSSLSFHPRSLVWTPGKGYYFFSRSKNVLFINCL